MIKKKGYLYLSKIIVILITLFIGIYAFSFFVFDLFFGVNIDEIFPELESSIALGILVYTILVSSLQFYMKILIYDKSYANTIKKRKAASIKLRKYENDDLEIFIIFILGILTSIFTLINYDILTAKRVYKPIIRDFIIDDIIIVNNIIIFLTIAVFAIFFLSAHISIFFKKN